MNCNIPIMSNNSFCALKAWFSGSNAASYINKLELIVVEKSFPSVVNFICDGKDRYFLVSLKLVEKVAKSIFQYTPVTPSEGEFLDCIKSQLDGRIQVIMDAESTEAVNASKYLPGFVRSFEAPCPRDGNLRRFVVEFTNPHCLDR